MSETEIRQRSLELLKSGLATPSEVARLAKISRQRLNGWLKFDKVDWRKARAKRLASDWRAIRV